MFLHSKSGIFLRNSRIFNGIYRNNTRKALKQSYDIARRPIPKNAQKMLAEWIEFLRAEQIATAEEDSDKKQIVQRNLSMVLPLKRVFSDAVEGIFLEFSTEKFKHDLDKSTLFSSIFKRNLPVMLKSFDIFGEIKCTGVIVDNRPNKLKIRLSGRELNSAKVKKFKNWDIAIGSRDCYEDIIEIIQDESFKKYPGYPLFLNTLRAESLENVVRNTKINFQENGLNESQMEAVLAAKNKKSNFIAIHGPPGTGKTRVIAEIVYQMVRKKKRIIVCAPSHKAVDNALIACLARGLNEKTCARLGSNSDPDVKDQMHAKTLLSMIKQHIFFESLENYYHEYEKMALENDKNDSEMEKLALIRNKLQQLKHYIRSTIIQDINVIFCTATMTGIYDLMDVEGFQPDLVIMDEAGQISEPISWRILLQAPRFVIAGDHKQLEAIVKSSKEATTESLPEAAKSLIERLMRDFRYKKGYLHLLNVNYRSNEIIQRWSNKIFYENKLETPNDVKNIHLRDITRIRAANKEEENGDALPLNEHFIDDPLVLLDTAAVSEDDLLNCQVKYPKLSANEFRESKYKNTTSYTNKGEALCVAHQLMALKEIGRLNFEEIACITPYTAQTIEIKKMLGPENAKLFDINSVDAFQGQQREAIVMSFVRNNFHNTLGFLANLHRMNVAITRAKRQFFLVTSSESLKSDESLRELYDIIRVEGRVIGLSELMENDPFRFDYFLEMENLRSLRRREHLSF